MIVRDICTSAVQSCSPETNLAEVGRILWEQDCGIVPVIDAEHRLVGVITDRDICMAVATRRQLAADIRVRDVMSILVRTCHPEDSVREALRIIRDAGVRRLPVVDEDDVLVGVLSVNDAIRASRQLKGRIAEAYSQDLILTLMAISEPRGKRALIVSEPRSLIPSARA
jgi:CBS domain-containing protein